ncbi:hypothetical protein LJR220_001550 [Bradyrhizobium sp. LjRoot220]|uniref:hypothetical protein n=1 Tax=Bradyrhizobium sp. LjRoot220 TaxID=3342284 RepID=UPI003ECEC5FC
MAASHGHSKLETWPPPAQTAGRAETAGKALAFAHYAASLMLAKGDPFHAVKIFEARQPLSRFIDVVRRSVVSAGTTTDTTWAAPLAQLQPISSAFVEFLRPQTILGRMSGFRKVPFNIRAPRATATTTTSRNITGGALSYNNITISANTSGGVFQFNGVATTYGNLTVAAPNYIQFGQSQTTVLASLTANGSSGSQPITLKSAVDGATATLSIASGAPTITWAGIRDITGAGGATFAATNSFDLGHNSGITITPPSVGGGGAFIGS